MLASTLLALEVEELNLSRPLAWQGFDSVLATEFKERLEAVEDLLTCSP